MNLLECKCVGICFHDVDRRDHKFSGTGPVLVRFNYSFRLQRWVRVSLKCPTSKRIYTKLSQKTETILFHCFSPWTHRIWLAAGAQIDDWSTRHVKSMVGLLRKITHPRLSAICTVFHYLRDIPWCNCSQYSMPGDPQQLLHGHCIILICCIIYVRNGIDMAINLNTIVWPYLADCVTKWVWKSFSYMSYYYSGQSVYSSKYIFVTSFLWQHNAPSCQCCRCLKWMLDKLWYRCSLNLISIYVNILYGICKL